MPMLTSQILRSVDFTKTQKSRYLESKTLFFLQNKKINYTSWATLKYIKIVYFVEVTFNKLVKLSSALSFITLSAKLAGNYTFHTFHTLF